MTQMAVTTLTQSLTACRVHGERGEGGRRCGAGVILRISLAQSNTSCSVTLPRQPNPPAFLKKLLISTSLHLACQTLGTAVSQMLLLKRYLIKYCPLGKHPYLFISFSSHQTGTAEKNCFGCWVLIRSSKMEKRSE